MGQKVSPIGLRLGIVRNWDSKWFAKPKDVPAFVKEDAIIRKFINKDFEVIMAKKLEKIKDKKIDFRGFSISHIEIERSESEEKGQSVIISIYTARPGAVVGAGGETKKELTEKLEKLTKKTVNIKVFEVKYSDKIASIVARSIADQLEKRGSFRRAQKMAILKARKAGALGIKTLVSGRLNGAEIARSEGYSEGRVPLHTLKANIDYATAEALTTYGILGVKVWIYDGDVPRGTVRKVEVRERNSNPNPFRQENKTSDRGNKKPSYRDNKGGK
ncbi:MAG: 30S ribosomal protein S3 [Acholeplasmatales bacterium]|jgi:small subunit ribosomal protein S3|nr:30S ribosomal protein S3 [Acholeplasmatales bacterium]